MSESENKAAAWLQKTVITDPKKLIEMGISANEILINRLFGCGPFSTESVTLGYEGNYKGRKFWISHSHIQERTDGGGLIGAMMGVRTKVVRDYHEYRLEMATKVGGSPLDGISFKTGEYNAQIDLLLENLYWHAVNSHHESSVNDLLGLGE
jgi:hypothetical protein